MEENKISGFKKINNFILYKELGRGSYGEVYLSKDQRLDKLTAVKVINRKKITETIGLQKFLNQINFLSKLNHPNTTKILDKQKTSNNYYIELEYCNGPDLLEYLKHYKEKYHKPLSEKAVQKIAKQIAKGLEYLHKLKIIHRDIKLENLVINFDNIDNSSLGLTDTEILKKKISFSSLKNSEISPLENEKFTIKICDFGFSREVDENNQASTMLGTPLTMAPDVLFPINGENLHYGQEADIWSLGVCIYELLIGKVPFNKKKLKQLLNEIHEGVFDYPTNVDISFESISFINGLLQYDPKKRMTWEKMWKHPFMTKDVKDFHPLKLTLNLDNKIFNEKLQKLKVDSKNNDNNFLWLIYNDGYQVGLELDKIDDDFLSTNFNENYFGIKEEEEKDVSDNDVKKKNIDYNFIDLTGKNGKILYKEEFEIYNSFVSREGDDDWEIISTNSQDI